jgi:hypothetical protein
MRYKLLGFAVWQGGKWYARKRYGRFVPSRRVASAGAVVLGVGVFAALAARRERRSA